MAQGKAQDWEARALELIERRWKLVAFVLWLLVCAWFLYQKSTDIRYFGLGDTDDNMRMMQVRGLLHGQGWFDLRDYRMNPPFGANIHWSRLVDPLAYPFALLAILFADSTNSMFMPERIDHHGWQLAFLALSIAGMADPKRLRGGLVLGITSALSLAIGLEMIIYLALFGVAMVLFWVD